MTDTPKSIFSPPTLILCAPEDDLYEAFKAEIDSMKLPAHNPEDPEGSKFIQVSQKSILDVGADAVVSPANSLGIMGGGIDGFYAKAFPPDEDQDGWYAYPGIQTVVQKAIAAWEGHELPVGGAVIVNTQYSYMDEDDPQRTGKPRWLISAPTMARPGTYLGVDTIAPLMAASAVFRAWLSEGTSEGDLASQVIETIAMPGLGTGVGGVPPKVCARQVRLAWEMCFGTEIWVR